jgi:outer membrane protein W
MLEDLESDMAVMNLEDDIQQLGTDWNYKISGIDIELKEKQFMNAEVEYYKEVKTKFKKNTHAEDKKLKFFR